MFAGTVQWTFHGLSALVDAGAERLAEGALVVILALAKGWNLYTDRRDRRRSGRRATDREDAGCRRAIARIETITAELTKATTRLNSRVSALERRAKDPEA